MVLCKFFQQGNCRYGNSCKFEHPRSVQGAFGKSPFPAYSPNNNNPSSSSAGGRSGSSQMDSTFSVSKENIQTDLTKELPIWILSSYGPGRDAPEQLFGGYPREQSFEEARLYYEMESAQGRRPQAEQELMKMYNSANEQIMNALGNLDRAAQFVVAAKDTHPNRIDVCKQTAPDPMTGEFSREKLSQRPGGVGSSPFGGGGGFGSAATGTTTSAFGQPSGLGQSQSPFGSGKTASPFGQAAPALGGNTGASAFGQPSALGGAASGFGAKPGFGATGFGQSGQLGQKTSVWGSPSAFGAGAAQQPQQPQTSAFGAAQQPQQAQTSAFGSSAFGQPGALGGKPSPFAASPFTQNQGQQQQAVAGTSPFGQPQNQNQQANAASPFGAASAITSGAPPAFAQASQQKPNPFGQPQISTPFGGIQQQQQPSTGFGTGVVATGGGANPFGQPAVPNQATQQQQTNGFGAPSSSPFAQANKPPPAPPAPPSAAAGAQSQGQQPDPNTYITYHANGTVKTFKSHPVSYREGENKKPIPCILTPSSSSSSSGGGGGAGLSQTWKRIWFPQGAPGMNKDTELPNATYPDEAKAMFQQAMQTGGFSTDTNGTNGGKNMMMMPDMPPKREWCVWDF